MIMSNIPTLHRICCRKDIRFTERNRCDCTLSHNASQATIDVRASPSSLLSVLLLNCPSSTCQTVCSSRTAESLDLSNTEMVPGGQQDATEKLRSAKKSNKKRRLHVN